MTSGKIYGAKIYGALTGSVFVAAVFMVGAVAPAAAQVVRIPQAAPDQLLPAYEVVNLLRQTGLDPSSALVRQGVTYRLRAIDRAGRDVNVVVDARFGDILLVEPAMDGPYPERRVVAAPPNYDDPNQYDRPPEMYSDVPANPPRVIKQAPKPRVATVPAEKHAPVPRPRPEPVAAQTTPAPAAAATTPAAAPPAPKSETAPTHDSPTKWKDEPAPTNAPAAATPATPKGSDAAPSE